MAGCSKRSSCLIRMLYCSVLLLLFGSAGFAQDSGSEAGAPPIELFSTASTPKVDTLQYSGAALTSIPILVPPGRAGLSPSLSLTYNSYAKNGWIGMGFGLELGVIQRSVKWGLNYQGREFTAGLAGSTAELVPRPDWGGEVYGARIEGAFTKYVFKGATTGWEAWSKDGRRFYFGSSAASRQEDPADPGRVFKWCLDRVEDSNGNFMAVEYIKDRGEIYPSRVSYTGNRGLAPANAVIFHLEDRPDAGPMFSANFGVTTAKRLKTIEVRAGRSPVRAYGFEYTQSPSTGRSLLASVTQFGANARLSASGDIVSGSSLPPTRFDWQEDAAASFSRPLASGSVIQNFNFGGNRDQVIPFDFNGDGNMDLFLFRPEWGLASVLRSNGDGSFSEVYWSNSGIGGYNLMNQEDKALAFDFDGDGKSDLFFYRPDTGNVGIARSNGDGSFSSVYLSQNGICGYDFKSLRDRALAFDFDGDGKSDLCLYRPNSGKIFVLRSNGDGSFTPVYSSSAGIAGYNLNGSTDRVFAFDFDGDGRSDLCLYRPDYGMITVARSNGDGTFTSAYASSSGIAGYNLKGTRDVVFPFDFNGDGKSDLFLYRPDSGLACVARSNGDGSFTQVYYSTSGIAGYNLKGTRDVVFPFDFNGDGKSDLFLYRPDSGLACVARSNGDGSFTQVYYSSAGIGGYPLGGQRDVALPFDFNGDGKADIFLYRPEGYKAGVVQAGAAVPDLLTRIENSLGGTTEIAYTASSRCANHLLPFVVHPVAEIKITDGIGASPAAVTRFAYSGGYYDYQEKEFRGFETITQILADGSLATTVFHQDKYLQGKSRLIESYESAAGPQIARTELSWDKTELHGSGAFFVKLLRKASAVYDGETVFSDEQYLYDDETGSLVRTKASGTGAESITRSTVYGSFGAWLLRPTRETVEGSASGKLREAYLDYEDKTGNLRSKELWLEGGSNPKVSMAYDAFGNLVSATDALGQVTETEYDAETRTFPVRVRLPRTGSVEHVKTMEVDPRFGKPAAVVDENGNRTFYAYDEFGRLVLRRLADGGEAEVEYLDDQLPVCVVSRAKETDAGGAIRSYQYVDGLGRTVQAVGFGEGGKPIVTRNFYDDMGRNHYSAGPYFAAGAAFPQPVPGDCPWLRTSFDRRGGPVRIEKPDPERGTVAAVFAFRGLVSTATDPDGGAKTEVKDYLGRVKEVIEHAEVGDALTTYAYNAAGDLLSVTNALGQAITMTYDSLGRKTGMTDPDMGSWSYAYDAAGRLVAQTDAKDQKVSFTYDPLGRVLSKTYSTNDPAVSYVYDGPGVPNGIGRLYQVKNAVAATTYKAYDAMGRQLEVGRSILGAPRSEYSTHYAYDACGRLISTRYPDNYQVAYNYHPGTGLLKSVIGITDFTDYAEFESYDAAGRARYVYHGNGTATTNRFDAASGRLVSITTQDPNLAQLQQKTYQYSAAGDILGISDVNAQGAVSRSYQYDRRHRLVAETSTGAPDAFEQAVIAPVFDDRFPLHGPKWVNVNGIEYSIGYDENGNMVHMPGLSDPGSVRERNITYNADNMPVRISYAGENGSGGGGSGGGSAPAGGGLNGGCFIGSAHAMAYVPATVELAYDGEGRRVVKRVHGTRPTFYVGGHFEVIEGIETKYIFAGSLRIAKVSSASPHFYHKDHLGSSTLITDYENGLPVETADFLPFGLTRNHTGANITRHKYTDQEEDAETGLYNYNARLYDPALGMFITPDAIVQDPFDPQALNRYAYARNNPLTYTDPSGHFALVDDIIIGATLGAAIGGITAAVTGDDIGKGMLTGAIGGALFGAAGFGIQSLGAEGSLLAVGIHTAAGAASGGINAAITGGDVKLGMLTGGISGGIGNFSGNFIPADNFAAQLVGRTLVGGITGGISSEIYGGSFAEGFVCGAKTAAIGVIANDFHNTIADWIIKWNAAGQPWKEYGDWEKPTLHNPSEMNVKSNVFMPGLADIKWQMTVSLKQTGSWEYFGGSVSQDTYTRTIWSKQLYYVKNGGGFVLPNSQYSEIRVLYGSPPNISARDYARKLGY